MKRCFLFVVPILLTGCSVQPPIQKAPVQVAVVVPTPHPTPTLKPFPTLSPSQQRSLRVEKRRTERAEKRRLARLKREQQEQKLIKANNQPSEISPSPSVAAQLASKYAEDEAQIRRMTVKAQDLLREDGIYEDTNSIMEAMNEALPHRLLSDSGENNQRYAEYVALYVTQRKAGVPRSEIVTGLRVLTG